MNDTQEQTSRYDETTPVLIAGGSLVGLSMSLFLSWHGIPSLLVERHAGTSPHPRAFNFNMRTMEIFRATGVEEAVRRVAPPDFQNSGILHAESLAGRELGWVTQDTTGNSFSPVAGCILGQDALEPVLRARAEELGQSVGSQLRFATELVSFEQDAEGVSAVIRERASGLERVVRARYLVAADGNRSAIRQSLGTRTHGPGSLGHQLSILFSADVRGPLRGRRLVVCFVNNPETRRGTSLVFARNGDGFALFTPYFPDKGEREEDFAGERGLALIRGAIGIPGLPVEITSVTPWEVAVWAAGSFQQDNVFLVGDAAHVTPPAGAFGANTGIADAYNLAWKLAHVLQGVAHPDLLATYTSERQPVVRHTAEQSFLMFRRFAAGPAASGDSSEIVPYNTIAFGYRYASATSPSDTAGSTWYEDPEQPSGQPGTHAAHVVLEKNGARSSTLDLFGKHFVLLTGDTGESWVQAAQQVVGRANFPLDVYRIGSQGDFSDVENRFLASYGIQATGAVLVRPDGFVGWRSEMAEGDCADALERGLRGMSGYASQRVNVLS